MLADERKAVPATGDWLAEIKFDGYRMTAATGAPQLRTRNGADATSWFPEIVTALATLPPGCILDGEVCVLADIGRSDSNRLQDRATVGGLTCEPSQCFRWLDESGRAEWRRAA